MFPRIREFFGRKRKGVHTRIATFRPQATPPDPRTIAVEFTGKELVCGCLDICTDQRPGHPSRPYAGQVLHFTGTTPTTDALKDLSDRRWFPYQGSATALCAPYQGHNLYHNKIHENSFADIEARILAYLKANNLVVVQSFQDELVCEPIATESDADRRYEKP